MILTPPDRDEIEVTLLGRGVGESVVVHLGEHEWMIVDTVERGRVPAAEWYLRALDVDLRRVKVLVLTDFHRDHYQGIDRLFDKCTSARMAVTRALRHDRFVQLYSYEEPSNELPGLFSVLRRAKEERRLTPLTPGLLGVEVGQSVYAGSRAEVKALSPTVAAVDASCGDIAHAVQAAETGEEIDTRLRVDNRVSVVLHVKCKEFAVLLGADLENTPAAYGWQAVLQEPLHAHLPQSDLVKVPHHGSEGAHHPPAWAKFVAPRPWLLVARTGRADCPGSRTSSASSSTASTSTRLRHRGSARGTSSAPGSPVSIGPVSFKRVDGPGQRGGPYRSARRHSAAEAMLGRLVGRTEGGSFELATPDRHHRIRGGGELGHP
jgi:hypothetical protein